MSKKEGCEKHTEWTPYCAPCITKLNHEQLVEETMKMIKKMEKKNVLK